MIGFPPKIIKLKSLFLFSGVLYNSETLFLYLGRKYYNKHIYAAIQHIYRTFTMYIELHTIEIVNMS